MDKSIFGADEECAAVDYWGTMFRLPCRRSWLRWLTIETAPSAWISRGHGSGIAANVDAIVRCTLRMGVCMRVRMRVGVGVRVMGRSCSFREVGITASPAVACWWNWEAHC